MTKNTHFATGTQNGGHHKRATGHRHIEPYWFYDEISTLDWIQRSRDVTMEYTAFGLNLTSGNYEFALLIAIHDPDFYIKHKNKLTKNWEIESFDCYSSCDKEGLINLLNRPDWTGEGLFAFVEGLKRLKEISPEKVAWSS